MSDARTGQLVKMLNEIARNLALSGSQDGAGLRTAEHLRRFWTRDMQGQVLAYLDAGGGGLLPEAAQAMELLREDSRGSPHTNGP